MVSVLAATFPRAILHGVNLAVVVKNNRSTPLEQRSNKLFGSGFNLATFHTL